MSEFVSGKLSAEEVGMLNGRQAALHAAIADMLAKGALVQNGDTLRPGGLPRGVHLTSLQEAVRRAVYNGNPPAQDDSVKTQLGQLQERMAAAGYLRPAGRAGSVFASLGLVLVFVIVGGSIGLAFAAASIPTPMKAMPWLILLFAIFVILKSARAGSKAGGSLLTAKGRETLANYRSQFPGGDGAGAPPHLGHSVGLYGTRGMLMAFPAAAALGVPLIDIERQQAWAAGSGSSVTCGGGSSFTPSWCGGDSGHSCGSGCSSSSCGSHSSCGGHSSCGSSCSSCGGGCSS